MQPVFRAFAFSPPSAPQPLGCVSPSSLDWNSSLQGHMHMPKPTHNDVQCSYLPFLLCLPYYPQRPSLNVSEFSLWKPTSISDVVCPKLLSMPTFLVSWHQPTTLSKPEKSRAMLNAPLSLTLTCHWKLTLVDPMSPNLSSAPFPSPFTYHCFQLPLPGLPACSLTSL